MTENTAFRIVTETNPYRMARVKAMMDLDSNKEQEDYGKAIAELEEKRRKAFEAVIEKYLPEATKLYKEAEEIVSTKLKDELKERKRRS